MFGRPFSNKQFDLVELLSCGEWLSTRDIAETLDIEDSYVLYMVKCLTEKSEMSIERRKAPLSTLNEYRMVKSETHPWLPMRLFRDYYDMVRKHKFTEDEAKAMILDLLEKEQRIASRSI